MAGSVVGKAEAAIGAEQDDAAVSAEAVVEIGDGLAGGELGMGAGGDAVGGPLAENQLHDGFAPSGERNGGGKIVGVAAAADERRIADAAGSLVEGAAGGSSGGKIAVDIESDRAHGVMRIQQGGIRIRCEGGFRALVVAQGGIDGTAGGRRR